MKMRKIGLASLVVFLMIVSITLVSALNTPIKVKTYPNHVVSIDVVDPKTEESLKHSYGLSDNYGEYSIDFVSESRQFALVLLVSKDKKFVVSPTKFGNFSTGQSLEFKLLKGVAEQIKDEPEEKNTTNETLSAAEKAPEANSSESTENTSIESSEIPAGTGDITGQAIAETDSKGSFLTSWYAIVGYIIIGILIISFVTFIVGKKIAKNGIPRIIKIKKYSDFKKEKENEKKAEEGKSQKKENTKKVEFKKTREIEEAEKKLLQAQQEVERLRKMQELQNNLQKTQLELDRLRKGFN